MTMTKAKPKKARKVNGNAKGKAGEREFANFLKERGLEARRGQQFKGGTDSPDVVCAGLTRVHFEVKRVECFELYKAVEQATRDANGVNLPIVAHRRNNKDWIAVVPMEDMIKLLKMRELELVICP